MSEQVIFDYTIAPTYAADIIVLFSAKQYYHSVSGNIPWIVRVYLDGSQINYAAGAAAYTDAPTLQSIVKALPAGNHEVKVTWQANNNLQLYNASLSILAAMK